jgi:hypothetical protein
MGTCLPSRCLGTVTVYKNRLKTRPYATILMKINWMVYFGFPFICLNYFTKGGTIRILIKLRQLSNFIIILIL